MSEYSVLFIGDVVGRPGREALARDLPRLLKRYQPLFTIVNGENAASGVGITPPIAEEIFALGVDGITLGNHAYHKREIFPYLDSGKPICRPANQPSTNPGKGWFVLQKGGIEFTVMNLCGRVYMDQYDDPFRESMKLVEACPSPHILVDFHAEATSEKIAMGYFLDGKVTAVLGTHTHVTTADERVLAHGTATITDVGMTGPINSVLGMDKEIILRRFQSGLPERFEVGQGPGVISGVLIGVESLTGRARSIQRIGSADGS